MMQFHVKVQGSTQYIVLKSYVMRMPLGEA